MKSRLELQQKLEEILGSRNVYFQPPTGLQIKYPCIIYHKQSYKQDRADDKTYLLHNQYQVMVITKDPDSNLPKKLIDAFQMISFATRFVKDNLYHESFNLYY